MPDVAINVTFDPLANWREWANSAYENLGDVVSELIDNSLSATADIIETSLTQDKDGRTWFTNTDYGKWPELTTEFLSVVFARGNTSSSFKKGRLGEHGCGLKNVLAYTDRSNNEWCIYIVKDKKKYCIKAPYNENMSLKFMNAVDEPDSTTITVPISDDVLGTLYKGANVPVPPKRPDLKTCIKNLKDILRTKWMLSEKRFNLKLNGDEIVQFNLFDVKEKMLPEVKMQRQLHVLEEGRPPVFVTITKCNMANRDSKDGVYYPTIAHQGVNIARSGRVIGAPVMKDVYGREKHQATTNWCVFVNVEPKDPSDMSGIPPSLCLKNGFDNKDPRYKALCRKIAEIVPLVVNRDGDNIPSEYDLLREWIARRKKILKGVDVHEIRVDGRIPVQVNGVDVLCHDRVDYADQIGNNVLIAEAKREKIRPPHVDQLAKYFLDIKHSIYSNSNVTYLFLSTTDEMAPDVRDRIKMWQSVLGEDFNPTIEKFN